MHKDLTQGLPDELLHRCNTESPFVFLQNHVDKGDSSPYTFLTSYYGGPSLRRILAFRQGSSDSLEDLTADECCLIFLDRWKSIGAAETHPDDWVVSAFRFLSSTSHLLTPIHLQTYITNSLLVVLQSRVTLARRRRWPQVLFCACVLEFCSVWPSACM